MKSQNKKSKLVLVLILVVLSLYNVSGQDSYIKNRINVKLGFSKYKRMFASIDDETTSNFRMECNYGILNIVEVGAYFGLSNFFLMDLRNPPIEGYQPGEISIDEYRIPFYGINANLHILPIFIKAADFRFDFYLAARYGGMYFPHLNNYKYDGHESEYGIGPGLSFYLWKHIGVYGEYCVGKYYYENNKNLRFGISLKF